VAPGVSKPTEGEVATFQCNGKAVAVSSATIVDGHIETKDFGKVGVRFGSMVATVGAGDYVSVAEGIVLPERAIEVYVQKSQEKAFVERFSTGAPDAAARPTASPERPSPTPATAVSASFRIGDAELQVASVELDSSSQGSVPAGHPPGYNVLAVEVKVLSGQPGPVAGASVSVSDEAGNRQSSGFNFAREGTLVWLFPVPAGARKFRLHLPDGSAFDLPQPHLVPTVTAEPTPGPQPTGTSAAQIETLQQARGLVYADADVVATHADGTQMGYGPPGTLPKGFPGDVPVYPGDIPSLNWVTVKSADAGTVTFNVNLSTTTDRKTVLDWYRSRLASRGWKLGAMSGALNDPSNDRVVIDATNATRVLKVTISQVTGPPPKTSISLNTWPLRAPATTATVQPAAASAARPPAAASVPPSPTAPPVPDATVKLDRLNLRDGPGTEYPSLQVLQQGDSLTVLGKYGDCAWLNVIAPGGHSGWVSGESRYVTLAIPCDAIRLASYRPVTGQVERRVIGFRAMGWLQIENGTDSDGLVILADANALPAIAAYIRAGESYKMTEIPDGVYSIFYAKGEGWDSQHLRFKTNESLRRFVDTITFKTTTTTYSSWSVTLYGVPGGTAAIEGVPEESFPVLRYTR
jgi:hypothetical protein